ncbi:MAG: hypothetical protein ABS58_02910 [Mesorhizobium sp. SCN 65-20]|nr:MAG: hypothetical protein ABS58_02910 [Mesorhizobium sp. SCN 65-20]
MTKRNLFLVLFAGLAPFSMPAAMAADVASNYYAPQESSAGYDWSGTYAGAHGGITKDGFPNPFSDKTGWQIGAQTGINFQSGMFVYGGELEGSYSNGATYNIGNGAKLERNWDAAAKVRAGVALDRTLVYGTAGYGVTKFDPKRNVTSGDNWEGGLLLGAGVEQALGEKLSAKAEYNHVDYGKVTSTVAGVGRSSKELSSQTLKLGVNYRF